MNKISVKGNTFTDEYGRERIFNGINVCDKGSFNGTDRDYVYSWDDDRIKKFKELGFNVIRLGITWDAVEPQRGVFNDRYLDAIEKIMDCCAENGIFVYIDMHQDLYSGFGGGPGDGAPAWACLTDKYKYKMPMFVWAEGYFWGRAVHRAFDNFWENKPLDDGIGVQEHYRKMWSYIAARFADHPALFGFDLMNEPFIGRDGIKVLKQLVCSAVKTTLTDKRINKKKLLSELLKKDRRIHALDLYTESIFSDIVSRCDEYVNKFDRERYYPFLCNTTGAVRQITDNGIIMIENSYYSNTGIRCAVKPIELDGKREEKQAYSPHAYDLMVDTPMYKYANNGRVRAIFLQRRFEQEYNLKMPVIVGEWGGNSVGTQWLPHVEYLLGLFDEYKWSNTYWDFSGISTFDTPLLKVLNRPHPVAVTGQIEKYEHNREQNCFTLSYEQTREYDAPTEIYTHKPILRVDCECEYDYTPLNDTAGILSLKSGIGHHDVTVVFEGDDFD